MTTTCTCGKGNSSDIHSLRCDVIRSIDISGEQISLYEVRDIMLKAGVAAHVFMTGGGVHTLYAGPQYTDRDGNGRYTLIAGPADHKGLAWVGNFAFGPDDDGVADADYIIKGNAESVAKIFIDYVTAHQC